MDKYLSKRKIHTIVLERAMRYAAKTKNRDILKYFSDHWQLLGLSYLNMVEALAICDLESIVNTPVFPEWTLKAWYIIFGQMGRQNKLHLLPTIYKKISNHRDNTYHKTRGKSIPITLYHKSLITENYDLIQWSIDKCFELDRDTVIQNAEFLWGEAHRIGNSDISGKIGKILTYESYERGSLS